MEVSPAKQSETFGSAKYRDDLLALVRGLIRICKLHGHRHLVLSAWGCGARKHPPERVAEAFKEALNLEGDAFFQIIFAIKNDQKADKAFRDVFGTGSG